MTFEQYWAILLKQWKLILICFLVVGLGAFIGSKIMTPLYQSTVLVQVAVRSSANNQADYSSLLASDELVLTEVQLAVSDPVLRVVASHYPGITTEQLSKEVTSTPRNQTQLFEIDVLDPNPAQAAALANDVAATLIKQQLQGLQQDDSQSRHQMQQDLNATARQINATTIQISSLQARGGNPAQISLLQARLSGLQQHYSQWQASLAQLELTEAQNANLLRIVQAAEPALGPSQPRILLNTGAGLLVGLFLGMLLAILYDRLDVRVRTPETVTQLLDWPVLTTILRAPTAKKEDIFNPTGHDGNVERFRILRSNIGFLGIDKPLHSLMVTSATPRDGKSIIAANLAIFMAKAGKSTLLIDMDLRRPSLHQLFDLPIDKLGLSNAVLACSMSTTTSFSLEPFIHSVDIPNLWVMPSGPLPPNPSELLDSKAMQHLLTIISNSGVEVVIFDTPPLLGLSDVSILASKVDGTLVVVDITRANKGSLKQAKTSLTQAGGHVLGCIVNKYRRSRHDAAYSYYYYYETEQLNGNGNHDMKKEDSQVSVPTTNFEQQETHSDEGIHNTEITNGPATEITNGRARLTTIFKRPQK